MAQKPAKKRRKPAEPPPPPGPVLAALDFSDDSGAALAWAIRQAAMTGAAVVALHVIHDPAESPGFYTRPGSSELEPMSDVAEEMMEAFLAGFADAHPELGRLPEIRREFAPGLPGSRIPEIAAREGASLIVMGTKGRTGLPGLILGSVAEDVLKTATMPVVVVKAPRAEDDD